MENKFAAYLTKRLQGVPLADIEARAGIPISVTSRVKNGSQPSFTTVFRLSWYLGESLARLSELAGFQDLAQMARDMLGAPPSDAVRSPKSAQLHLRLERLLNRGLERRVESAFQGIESAWEVLRPSFESLAESLDAQSAVLAAYREGRDPDVYFHWRCNESQARMVAADKKASGWRVFEHAEGEAALALFLKEPGRKNPTRVREALSSWSAGMQSISG